MDDLDFIKAMRQGIPPLPIPDPLDRIEAENGICCDEKESDDE